MSSSISNDEDECDQDRYGIKLIELKLRLLNDQNNMSRGRATSVESTNRLLFMDSLKRLKLYHEKKLLSFKSRILFFENYLMNNLNKYTNAMRLIDANRHAVETLTLEMDEIRKRREILKKRRHIMEAKLDRYRNKFDRFMSTSNLLLETNVDAASQLVSIDGRYDNLTSILDENRTELERNVENLIRSKAIFAKFCDSHLVEKLALYKSKLNGEEELKMEQTITFNSNDLVHRRQQQMKQTFIEFNQIIWAIDNLLSITEKFPHKSPSTQMFKIAKKQELIDSLCEKLNKISERFQVLNSIYEIYDSYT